MGNVFVLTLASDLVLLYLFGSLLLGRFDRCMCRGLRVPLAESWTSACRVIYVPFSSVCWTQSHFACLLSHFLRRTIGNLAGVFLRRDLAGRPTSAQSREGGDVQGLLRGDNPRRSSDVVAIGLRERCTHPQGVISYWLSRRSGYDCNDLAGPGGLQHESTLLCSKVKLLRVCLRP